MRDVLRILTNTHQRFYPLARAHLRYFFDPLETRRDPSGEEMYSSPEPPLEAPADVPPISIDDARYKVNERLENLRDVLLKLDRSEQKEDMALEIIDQFVESIDAHIQAAEEPIHGCLYAIALGVL